MSYYQPNQDAICNNYTTKEVQSAVELIVDAEDLIAEIQARPAIWDINDEDYQNRDIRKQKWDEIITTLIKVEDASSELRNSFGKMLQRKWKSLRDCYSRERQRVLQAKVGGQPCRKTQYIFSTQLSFLDAVMKTKVIPGFLQDTSMEERFTEERFSEEEQIDQPSPSCSDVPLPTIIIKDGKRKRRKLAQSKSDFDFIENVLKENSNTSETRGQFNENTDRLFLLSLLEPLKKIPEPLRFGVRLQIMQIIYGALMGSFNDCNEADVEEEGSSSSKSGIREL